MNRCPASHHRDGGRISDRRGPASNRYRRPRARHPAAGCHSCCLRRLWPRLPSANHIPLSFGCDRKSWPGCAIPREGCPDGWPPARSGPRGRWPVPLWFRGNRIRVCSSRRCAIRKKICECIRARPSRSSQIRTFFIGVLVTDF